ncbi:MAG TPA: transglutaminase domain-containing protein [Polyangiaceae bacterium]|nr:transglutaminase domain-containing protein [Polyangiaceae bacterium]
MTQSKLSSKLLRVAGYAPKALVMVLVYALPILGVWAASSLAAYLNGPRWAPFVAGALAFPLLPVSWEALSKYQRSRNPKARPHILTLADRLTLRTLAVNLLFLGTILTVYPSHLFAALSARGDWFVSGKNDPTSQRLRALAFAAADRFEWLYELTHTNPFEEDEPPPPPPPPTVSAAQPKPAPTPTPTAPSVATAKPTVEEQKPPTPPPVSDVPSWPFEIELHPVVQTVPPAAEASPAAVGTYLREHVPDIVQRVKAVHDYVADRIAYDVPALSASSFPPQDAVTVLASRKGVCEGYSRLMVAVGKAAGLEIVQVVGYSRDMGGDVSGAGHAWNAVRIAQAWYLVDATWDAGFVNSEGFTKKYTTDYFLSPPEVFGTNHFPDEPRWQLRASPISRGDFIRQPNLRPGFFAHGLRLRQPDRSQVSVTDSFLAEIDNPRNISVRAYHGYKGGYAGGDCQVEAGPIARVVCPVSPGQHHVQLFVGKAAHEVHWFVGQFEVNRPQ